MNCYHVLELAGEGSFGRVYKGRKKGTGQVVALKFMPKLGRSEKELRSLKREIEIMRDLKHPNIVQLFDSFETDTEVVVVTEYAEGQLFQILEDDGNLPESQVQEIACQLVSALYYLHSHRILHRDMKPQNILLGKSGVVKLCDFGFARAMSVSTLVLTSIKGTPLYMSPELVEEKPYDHTADLWSLGCILYELHTGAPPFYTNSLFHLVQLIVKDQVKWPETMGLNCRSFLKGLLTKDPQKRLSWPALLHHPFVADGVLVLSDTNVFSPLTVTPSPDVVALKLKQVAEKSAPPGESRLLRKAREQMEKSRKPTSNTDTKKQEDETKGTNSDTTLLKKSNSSSRDASPQVVMTSANQSVDLQNKRQRGAISRDYEQEFPSVEVGPRLVRRASENNLSKHQRQHWDSKKYWENLVQRTDPSREQKNPLQYKEIIPQIKSKIDHFKAQLTAGMVEDVQQIQLPLKVSRNLMAMPELQKSNHMDVELQLPHVLFYLICNCVENPNIMMLSEPIQEEMMLLILIYCDQHVNWLEEETSLEDLTKPFDIILSQTHVPALAALAACVLSLFTRHVDVQVDVEILTLTLKNLLSGSNEPLPSLPPSWGLCDGLLSLLLHALSEHQKVSLSVFLDSGVFVRLWETIGRCLDDSTPDLGLVSITGLQSFFSLALFIFTLDPYTCVPLFTPSQSTCVRTLSRLLRPDCFDMFPKEPPERAEEFTCAGLTTLCCHLLCFPFALELPTHTTSAILQVYDEGDVVSSLLQVVQSLPLSLLELPLSLLSRLLMCDPEHSLAHIKDFDPGLFTHPEDDHQTSSRPCVPPTRTASSLLSDFLQQDVLWDSAVELLTLLSQLARLSPHQSQSQLHVEGSVLQQGLTHSYEQIRVSTCRLLGHMCPFTPPVTNSLPPDVFKDLIECLCDPSMPVRRMASRAVGNWLGHMAERGAPKKDLSLCDGAAGDGGAVTDACKEEAVRRRWTEEARRSVGLLAGLISDPDAVTRRHCCMALGNLVHLEGVAAVMAEEDVHALLLRAARTDSHYSVKQAAISALSQFSQRGSTQQILESLDATKKFSKDASSHSDYQQLLGRLL